MYRIVRVVASNGKAYEVPLTGEQADFFLRMAEFKAASNPTVTFNDLLAEKREKELQSKSKQRN